MKPVSRDWDEFCYPFIYEDSPICDFEILSDELCCRVGLVLSLELEPQVREILQRLQPRTPHAGVGLSRRQRLDERAKHVRVMARVAQGWRQPARFHIPLGLPPRRRPARREIQDAFGRLPAQQAPPEALEKLADQNVYRCHRCGKCTAVCPFDFSSRWPLFHPGGRARVSPFREAGLPLSDPPRLRSAPEGEDDE